MRNAGLGSRAVDGLAFIGGAQAVRLLLTIVSTVIVSRILSPQDFGIIAMAAPATGFILLFQDLGLGQAAVQARDLSSEKVNGLFWVNAAATIAIMVVLVLSAPLVAWFYTDPRPAYIVAASIVPIFIAGLSLQHNGLLNREMRYRMISVIDVVTNLAIFVATISAALLFRNYWALWAGALIGKLVQTIMLWRVEPWRPSLPIRWKGVGELARFGGNLTGFNLLNFLIRNFDNVLIARVNGAAELGLYDRSYRLMMLPLENVNAPLGRVMLPLLGRLVGDREKYRRAYLLASQGVLLATLPGIAVAAALSDEIIAFLLGREWTAAGPIFFWLSLMGLIQPLGHTTGWLFVTNHRTRELFRWGIFSGVITIAGFFVGVQWGAEGVAASLFITTLLRLPVLFSYSTVGSPVSAVDLWKSMFLPGIFVGVSWIVALSISKHATTGLTLIIALPIAYCVATAISACSRLGRDLLRIFYVELLARLNLT